MRFALMIEPQQGLSYDEQLAIAQRAEAAGFEALFRSDHYDSFPGEAGLPTTDAWAVLAGLARDTQRIGLGTLVSPVQFRSPGNLAKVAATVDEMSGGRVSVGLGAGWHEHEHLAHGFPFPPLGQRADRLEEALATVRGLWDGPDGWSFAGEHHKVVDAVFRPKPASLAGRWGGSGRRIPLITGGQGNPRAYRIAARYADEFNLSSTGPVGAAAKFAALDAACTSAGRDPATLVHSVMAGVCIARTDAGVRSREADLLRALAAGDDGEAWLDERRDRWLWGTRERARESVAAFAAAGTERIMLQDFLPRDLDMVDEAAEILFG